MADNREVLLAQAKAVKDELAQRLPPVQRGRRKVYVLTNARYLTLVIRHDTIDSVGPGEGGGSESPL